MADEVVANISPHFLEVTSPYVVVVPSSRTMNRSYGQLRCLLRAYSSRLVRQRFPVRTLASPASPTMTVSVDKQNANSEGKATTPSTSPRRDPLDLTFENAEAAFRSKSTWEVLRAYLVFTLCSSNYLVENNMKVNDTSTALLGSD